jgi:hypothetical protein
MILPWQTDLKPKTELGCQIWSGLQMPQTLQKLLMGNTQNDIR